MSGEARLQTEKSRRSRWARVVGGLLVVGVGTAAGVAIFGGISYINVLLRGNPDPGGRIVKALSASEVALPSDAHVTRRQEVEPYWISCSIGGPSGWNGAFVYVDFTSDLSTQAMLASANARLNAQGWKLSSPDASASDILWTWTRSVASGTALVQLSPVGKRDADQWGLIASAPPMSTRLARCATS